MFRYVRMLATGVVLLASVRAACSATLHVPSEYPTIEAGLAAAVAGDTVEVACGTYGHYHMEMTSGVVLRSETGDPECVTLRPITEGRFNCIGVSEGTVIEGLTFTGESFFSALECESQSNLIVRRCAFRETRSRSSDYAGALTSFDSRLLVEDCLFEENSGWFSAVGGVKLWASDATLRGCTFIKNHADVVLCAGGALRIEQSTFAGWQTSQSDVVLGWGATASIANCVFAYGYMSIECYTSDVQVHLMCCDIFGHGLGDWVGCIADQYGVDGNISADPQFCDLAAGDLTLQCTSPCAPFSPPNPECDLIGAWPVGCGGTAVQRSTWGAIKGLFRR